MESEPYKKIGITFYFILTLSMLYITFKITCNTLFFRQILFSIPFTGVEIKILSAAFIYPSIYVISDAIVAISNKRIAIFIVLIGALCDGIFSFGTFLSTTLQMPITIGIQKMNNLAINQLGYQFWKLYYHGLLAAIITAIAEILLFNFIFNKSRNFFISTVSSVIISLFFHNIITDYPMLKTAPDVWTIIFNGMAMNIIIMAIYAAVISIVLKYATK